MNINQIQSGVAIVQLHPQDCFYLARACHNALEREWTFSEVHQIMRLMESTFAALGYATEAQLQMQIDAAERVAGIVEEELAEVLFIPKAEG